VVVKDWPAGELVGLAGGGEVLQGARDGRLELVGNGARFLAEPLGGQKAGWFYDQRDHRAFTATLARDARVLDAYSYTGGFAVQAALAGAREVVAVERSQAALDLARESATRNGVADACHFVKAEVFTDLEGRGKAGETFDIVIVDPPAFVKTKKDYWQGLKGYRKLARLAATLVAPGGILVACSCSHHVTASDFAVQVRRGLSEAGRDGRILRFAGAGPDHPVDPWLPETSYLKVQVLALD
jgi:23S rRNA (cytosine1962-C5)-methyltransferase